MKLRSYLIALVIAALLPLVIFAFTVIVVFSREQRANLDRSLVDTARALSLAVDRELDASIRSLQVLATSEQLQAENNLKEFYDQAASAFKTQPYWGTIALIDEFGDQLLNLRLPFGAPPLRGPPKYPEASRVFETGQPMVSNLFIGRIAQAPLIAVTVPGVGGGRVKYARTASISPRSLVELISKEMIPADWMATIIDRNATVIARTRNFEHFVGKPATPLFAAKSRKEIEGTWREVREKGVSEY
jgi:hypothetical protein